MNTVQLYINNQRLDLFKEDSISITESIRNSRDISKVFTTFSKQFTVPASKENNKIFKHFYNFNIVGGYDSRKTQPALIELDNLTFKNGRIKLNGVKMKNNKPYAYNIVFFGSVVDLKDTLGEDKLNDLSQLSNYELGYSNSDIINALKATPGETALPLVTANQYLYYDSTDTDEGTGNLYYDATKVRGLNPRQLKYAIRLDKIIDAIEDRYTIANGYASNLVFASDSFFHDATKDIHKLYMWCHRKKDLISIKGGPEQTIEFPDDSTNPFFYTSSNKFYVDTPYFTDIEVDFSPVSNNFNYDIIITKNGTQVRKVEAISGFVTIDVTSFASFGDYFEVFIKTYEIDADFSYIQWDFEYREDADPSSPIEQDTIQSNKLSYDASFVFNIQEQIPEMRVIDFLSSLFKMFNLVAYVTESGEVQVQPLDTFYQSTEHDITDYVDVRDSEINAALPFKEIFFKYKDTKTILAAQHLQEIANVDWGGVEYTSSEELYGDIYKVEPAFNHSKLERLLDLSNKAFNTDVMYCFYVDDNLNGYLGDPYIMYINQSQPGASISINDNGVLEEITATTNINIPSNLEDAFDETSNNIHFNAEFSEYDGELAEETLFKRFYENYIVNIFDVDNRLTKLTAYLPKSKLVKGGNQVELTDVIILNGNRYRINSMNVNLTTGKTEFELINYYD